MKKNIRYQLLFTSILSCFLLGFSCGKSVEPVELPKDYTAYFRDGFRSDSNWYYAYHPSTNTIDSIFLPFAFPPQVSANCKKQYIRAGFSSSVAVLETDSFTVINYLPYDAVLSVSPDNKLIFAWLNNGMYLLKTSDYSVLYQDSTIGSGEFSYDGKRLYGLSNNGREIHRIELADSIYESAQFNVPFGFVRDFKISKNQKKIFFYLIAGFRLEFFVVYDIARDSIIFQEAQQPGYGEIELSPDGKYAFYTDPGQGMLGAGGPGWISVYDVASNKVLTRITTEGVLEPPYELVAPIREISVTPDGRWLVALPDLSTIGVVFAADIRKLAVLKYNKCGSWLSGLTTQNAP